MGKIKILDEFIANKIAAGEIIERPVSVIKELIENSLDAKANYINIEILEGGLNLIRVTDNGEGMTKEDALLAFERHATSKINNAEDLFDIKTFGFRGEALPSIAAVSQVLLTTCDGLSPIGSQVKIIGGKVESVNEVAFNKGTTIEVRNLFFNTPARRKFIKSIGYETGLITELISRYSLGHAHVRFKLKNKKEVVYDTYNVYSVKERLNNIYKDINTEDFIYVEKDEFLPNCFVEAWLALPKHHRNTRNQQIFFINGRLIKNNYLNKVLDESYHTLLPKGRFPIALLKLEIPAYELDVNIHPAKLEIKINNIENILNKLVNIFKKKLWDQKIENKSSFVFSTEKIKKNRENIIFTKKPSNNFLREADNFFKEAKPLYKQEEFNLQSNIEKKQDKPDTDTIKSEKNFNKQISKNDKKIDIKNIIDLQPLAQLNNSFILAQNKEGLFIIDQHTCHERILYEKFIQEEENKLTLSENLLIPITLTLSGEQEGILLKNILTLNNLGFVIENFGTRTYLLRSVPIGIKIEDKEKFFLDLIEELANSTNLSQTRIKETIITMAACKGAVKANQALTMEEIMYLLKELAKVKNPHSCPHGRPIFHKITMKELYRIFQRGEYRGG